MLIQCYPGYNYSEIKKKVPPLSSSPAIFPNWGFCWLLLTTVLATFETIVSMGIQASGLFARVLANVRVNWELSAARSYPAEENTRDDLNLVFLSWQNQNKKR